MDTHSIVAADAVTPRADRVDDPDYRRGTRKPSTWAL